MKIVLIRRISQIFFMALFLWFCIVSTLGENWWQLRGWPVNWFLQLDPLVGLGVLLTSHTVYKGLAWCFVTIVLTILLGRFFCGWVCPFGALHQFVGVIGKRNKSKSEKSTLNSYHKGQFLKYWILIFLLAAAAGDSINIMLSLPSSSPRFFIVLAVLACITLLVLTAVNHVSNSKKSILLLLSFLGGWAGISALLKTNETFSSSLQTGLLDPIPLFQRSVNLILIPIADKTSLLLSVNRRYYEEALIIGTIFVSAVLLNLVVPRFYCRFVCPLGALFGIFSRYSIWRIGQKEGNCTKCTLCETDCEGACEPSSRIRISECVLCMNCLKKCPTDLIQYSTSTSASGEIGSPDIERRELIVSALSGAALIPILRLSGNVGPNWNPARIRPPGAFDEKTFLSRCIKCGQCMRICPTNIIHPAGFTGGIEGLWTPALNFRIGTSGCQLNCIACGNVCPTAAIRPITLAEKLGKNQYAKTGPIRIGTAFVDRNRCLPWAMDKPCIVCQENCPVSPKAIFTRQSFESIRIDSDIRVQAADKNLVTITGGTLKPGKFATGDYFLRTNNPEGAGYLPVADNQSDSITLSDGGPQNGFLSPGIRVEIFVRLQKPFVDPESCIGCGTCEHECPVSGKRAIRVSAENESRNKKHALLL
ncbi:MAG: 4Fe-4S binding protein [Desulfobacterales bacterium]